MELNKVFVEVSFPVLLNLVALLPPFPLSCFRDEVLI